MCVCACDPLSDPERQLDQSEDLWQLANMLHSINNFLCAGCISCMYNYREKQERAAEKHGLDIVWSCTASGAAVSQSSGRTLCCGDAPCSSQHNMCSPVPQRETHDIRFLFD